MPNCVFEYVNGIKGWLYCPDCERYQIGDSLDINRGCNPAIETFKTPPIKNYKPGPSLTKVVFNFAKALTAHIGDGLRKRTKEQIEEILDAHCKPCQYFNGTNCTHKDCGCNVNRERRFFNKLAWKSEHCPLDKCVSCGVVADRSSNKSKVCVSCGGWMEPLW